MSEYNESQIQSNELERITQENERISNEVTRKANETERVTREDLRIEQELERMENESDRINKENIRKSAEDIRQENEIERQENETERQNNESIRQEFYSGFNSRLDVTEEQLEHIEKYRNGTISIKELGALCDGVTDETYLLQKAHDLLPEQGGKIIINPGKLVVSEKITFTKTITLEGTHNNFLTTTSSSCILLKGEGELIFKGTRSCVRNLFVDGESTTTNGLTFLCARPIIDNVSVINQGGYGVSIGDDVTDNINVNSWYIDNLIIRQCGNGLFVGDKNSTAPNANAGCCTKIDASYNDGVGITLKNSIDNNFLSCHIEMNDGEGIQLINASGNTFLKPYLEGNSITGDSTSIKNNVIGHRRDGNSISFENGENYYDLSVLTKGLYYLKNLFRVARLHIANSDTSGYWEIQQDAGQRSLYIRTNGTSEKGIVRLRHSRTDSKTELDLQQLCFNGGRVKINALDYFTGTVNFGTISAGTSKTIALTNYTSSVRGGCTVVPPTSLPSGVLFNARFNSNDQMVLTLFNSTTSDITVNASFKVYVTSYFYE